MDTCSVTAIFAGKYVILIDRTKNVRNCTSGTCDEGFETSCQLYWGEVRYEFGRRTEAQTARCTLQSVFLLATDGFFDVVLRLTSRSYKSLTP